MKENTLVEIPVKDWPKLSDLYVKQKLESNSSRLIQNYINWLNKDPTLEESVKIYSLNGDWSDGTFILQDHKYYVMMNTLATNQKRLLIALHCLDEKKPYFFYSFPVRIKKTIEAYIMDLGIEKTFHQFTEIIWYLIDMQKVLEFNIDPPEGITLSALRLEDTETINNKWPHHHAGSELFVGRLVKYNKNIGAYDENGKLVAWCLTLPLGCLGLLQVQDSHKRMGFGSLVVKAFAKQNAINGVETVAPVIENNTASRAMFERLGFQAIDKVYYYIKPALE